jgi:hypothetical protein
MRAGGSALERRDGGPAKSESDSESDRNHDPPFCFDFFRDFFFFPFFFCRFFFFLRGLPPSDVEDPAALLSDSEASDARGISDERFFFFFARRRR